MTNIKRPGKYVANLCLTALLIMVLGFTNAVAQTGGGTSKRDTTVNPAVAQRLSFVTIGAKDLNKLRQFYIEQFGWTPISSGPGIAFFKMNGFIFALYPEKDMAAGPGIGQDGKGFKRVTFTIYYPSEKEADDAFIALLARGVHMVKAPVKASWGGYVGYVDDIEGNIWEIGYNPYVDMDKDGNTTGHH